MRGFIGTGDRQYLTGLKVGGNHILLLIDVSASMLDETVVNILRMRNMSDTRKLMSDKGGARFRPSTGSPRSCRWSRNFRCMRSTPRPGR